ncbi:MAG: Na/Pi cotransporter family protein [Smithellaceae bacterium]
MKEILIAISGIILFLIGMVRLSGTARKIINVRIKQYIKYAVEKPLYGLFTGAVATVFFQSSSASIALTIGLVSAGLISFYSSLAIILGADIGTTLTVQFVVWRFTEISPVFISIGGLMWLTCRGKWKHAGEMIFYFGLIFFGLELVNQVVQPLKRSPAFLHFFAQSQNPFLGIGLGIVVTGIVHASAIPIGILVILAQQDVVSLENAMPIIMGANIGTTVTALLVGTVATVSGKRSAIAHLIFKCAGVLLFLIFMPYFLGLLRVISSSVAQQIVLGHFLLNLLIVLEFIFFLKPFARFMNKIISGEDEALPLWPEFLNQDDLSDTEKALGDVQKELQREMGLVQKMFTGSIDLIACPKKGKKRDISYIEIVVNNLRIQIVKFLWQISAKQLSVKLSQKLFAYTAIADYIESIGNHVIWITDLVLQKAAKKIKFSENGEREIVEIIDLVSRNLDDSMIIIALPSNPKSRDIISREEIIDIKVKDAREKHIKRFHKRLCHAEAGPIFVEMLIHLERISDHCNNIAEYILSLAKKHDFEK